MRPDSGLRFFPEGWTWQAKLVITSQMLDAFSRLTGDVNALHMDHAAAAAFPYRQRVAHGMLPVSVLLLAEPLTRPTAVISHISGRFNSPVFLDDTVTVTLALLATNPAANTQTFSFSVQTSSVNNNATYGELTLEFNASRPPVGREQETISLATTCLTENTLAFSAITKGQSEQFPFTLTLTAITAWTSLLRLHTRCAEPTPDTREFSPELGAALLSSTLAGMRLPGRLATFLDFSFHFPVPLTIAAAYTLQGTVDFISASHQIIVENIVICDKNTTSLSMNGKITVKMNEPSLPGPTMNDLTTDPGLKGKTVLITGASRGIGATTAKLFACYGANVIVNYLRNQAEADAVVRDITAHGGRAMAIKADVSRREDVKALVDQARVASGGIDILVNNAVGDFIPVPFQALTWERLQQDIDIIVKGAFNCCQETIPAMIQKKAGRIINVITLAVETPPPNQAKYVIAKSALIGLTRSLAVELAPHHILVNMVLPGMVETDLTKTIAPAVRDKIRDRIPLGRHPTTIDVAKAIVTLASELTPYTTGQKILVTGGLPPFI